MMHFKMTKTMGDGKVNIKKVGFRRKWTADEVQRILSFLRENEFEQPNGTVFYKKLTRDHKFPVDWKLVRCKVRNLRISYLKARSVLAAQGHTTPDRNLPSITFRVCPYYRELHEILKNAAPPTPRTSLTKGTDDPIEPNKLKASALNQVGTANALVKPATADESWEDELIDVGSASFDTDSMQLEENDENMNQTNTMNTSTVPMPKVFIKQERNRSLSPSPTPNITGVFSATDTNFSQMNGAAKSTNSDCPPPKRLCVRSSKDEEREEFLFQREIKIKELRLHEKELDIKKFELDSRERMLRMKLEMKERIALKKLELKYGRK
ncbi:uncharacterized protein LOC115620427 [Scaptodrosophila lebanonensis]|uniref:Uncharacterized protein LOC115620427 n=1 Tax=Drosophila lebanonensis TaxID=7225 RepID=A0A6J2T0F1_DROLE|nr:uncharacterized protein LOC115620427 [Scaptodrosophila lebanonensis]